MLVKLLREEGKGVTVVARLMGEDQILSHQQATYRNHHGRIAQAWEEFRAGRKSAMDLVKLIARVLVELS